VCLFLLLLFAGFVGVAMEAPVVGVMGMALVALGTPGALISAAIDGDSIRVRQFLMPGFEHERAVLHELAEWAAYYQCEPFGEERADLRAGIVASVIANVQ
jgi:hypothetical protein